MLNDEPAEFYTNGVWVEVLRFLFNNTGIEGNINIMSMDITILVRGLSMLFGKKITLFIISSLFTSLLVANNLNAKERTMSSISEKNNL